MPKMKSHRGASKRIKRTKSGNLKRAKSLKNHFLNKKSPKRKRNLRKCCFVSAAETKTIKLIIAK